MTETVTEVLEVGTSTYDVMYSRWSSGWSWEATGEDNLTGEVCEVAERRIYPTLSLAKHAALREIEEFERMEGEQ